MRDLRGKMLRRWMHRHSIASITTVHQRGILFKHEKGSEIVAPFGVGQARTMVAVAKWSSAGAPNFASVLDEGKPWTTLTVST